MRADEAAMKKLFAVLLALSMLLLLCACGTEDVSTAANPAAAEQQEATAPAEGSEAAPADAEQQSDPASEPAANANTVLLSDIPGEPEGDLGSYHIKLLGCDYCGDDNKNTAIIITFEFTNNSGDEVVPLEAITCQAFQDGMSISMASISDSPLYDRGAAMNAAVAPGATAVLQCAYTQASDAPIEFDVTEIAAIDGAKVYGSFDAAV